MGVFLSSVSSLTDLTEQVLRFSRLPGKMVRGIRAFLKKTGSHSVLLPGLKVPARGCARQHHRSDDSITAPRTGSTSIRTFRGVWVEAGPGARFVKNRLMQMNHRPANSDAGLIKIAGRPG